MNRVHWLPGALCAVWLAAQPGIASAQFQDLVRHLPDGANALVLFDVEKILESPLSAKEGWRERHEKLSAAGLILLPPGANRLAMAADMDFEFNQSKWEAAVMDLDHEPSMPKVAALHGGSVDEIQGVHTAALPSDTYVVQFGKSIAGIMSPGNRQDVGRWVGEVYSTAQRTPLSAYLKEAESFADRGTPIIMAMDLQHLMSPAAIRDHLQSSKTLEGKDVDLDKLSEVLASIRGVTLGITIGDQVFGKIKVDFEQDVAIMKDFAKPLLLEALANHGATINEFTEWTDHVSGTQVTLEGNLYQSGRQRILSILDAPPALRSTAPQGSPNDEQSQEKLAALASQQYFHSVTRLLDDLTEQRKTGQTSGQIGIWFQKYASKIDSLPILNVDSTLVEFGAYVSKQLRQAESAMKGVGARSAYRQTNMPNVTAYNYAYRGGARWGRYGAYGGAAYAYREDPRTSLKYQGQMRSRIRTQESIRGNTSANLIVQGLQAEIGEIRRQMTQKYNLEF